MNRVVVTGLGIAAPSGIGVEEFWATNEAGRSFVGAEPLMERIGMKSGVVARIPDFRLEEHHTPEAVAELSELSRFVQLSTTAAMLAVRDSCLTTSSFDPDRAGAVFSSAIGGTPEFQEAYETLSDAGAHPVRALPEEARFYDSVFLNFPPAWTARTFGLRGLCTSLTTGCTAGVDALGLGCDLVRHGDQDVVVCGAGEAPLSGLAYATLDIIGSLAVVDCPPERSSRPFDARRGGFVLGEGAATVVLEDYEHARARDARIYGEVLGYASFNNAFHMTDLASDGQAMAAVMREVLDRSAIEPFEVDYINAHGSSTPQNDLFETRAIKDVFGPEVAARIPISSTKSMIGHSLASASMVGSVAALGAMHRSRVPPTINYEFPDPECDLDYVPNQARDHDVRTALVTASGFGGIHSSAVFRLVGPPSRRAEAGS